VDEARPDLFEEFIACKRALGYAYGKSQLSVVRLLSRHLAVFKQDETFMTREAAESFYAPDGRRTQGTLRQRRAVVREFALFLCRKGTTCWVPPQRGERPPEPRFTPRIITAEEMARVIALVDQTPAPPQSPTSQIVLSAMIKTLWCCGLRIGEAVALTVGDADLASGVLTVRNGKGNHTRLVPMSPSLALDLAAYLERMGLCSTGPSQALFPNWRGAAYSAPAASRRVASAMAAAGITTDGARPPRTHDIRHSYAVQVLHALERKGIDPRAAVPLLGTYMGHRGIRSTEYYLRLTAPMREDVAEKMDGAYRGVFPEVG
jgi:integrase